MNVKLVGKQMDFKIIILTSGTVLISTIEEIGSELGEPDCKLIKPFEIKKSISGDVYLEPWNSDYTTQDIFKVHSDKILTISENPKPTLIEKYQSLIK